MLSDTKLRNLKPTDKLYKVTDRDGLYVAVTPKGIISFRYNYKVHDRYETLTLGRYGQMTLAEARAALVLAKATISSGESPARKKAREKAKTKTEDTFSVWADLWLENHQMAESTRDLRRSVYERDIKDAFGKLKLIEITHDDLRALCDKIVARGAPATAVQAREVVQAVYRYATDKGHHIANPADLVRPTSIAKFQPRERALASSEIKTMYEYLDKVSAGPSFKVACKLILLTMVRKSELTEATWDEINFSEALWTIPGARMKRRNPHLVYLSHQALDIFVALKVMAGASRYVLPSRYDADKTMSNATLNRMLALVYEAAQSDGRVLDKFGPHDLRRTASTLLHEAGYNTDWIEKCLAHEQKGVRAVYNKAEYAAQRRAMLQDWADMIDSFVATPS